MRQSGALSRDVRSQAPALRALGPGLPVVAGGDPQIAHIFRNMRAAMRLPREAIARRLATTPATIEDLESGAVAALPPWRETVRIVRAYCELLRLDPEPLLWRIQQLLRQGGADDIPTTRPPGPPPSTLRNLPVREPSGYERCPRRRGGLRSVLGLAVLPILAAGLAYVVVLAPAAAYKAITLLPTSMARQARAGLDTVVLYSAVRRDGLRWIDVGDPRLRKGDKLRTKAR
jgi:hypothetical protein